MNENELDKRLKAADPAHKLSDLPGDHILEQATRRKPNRRLSWQFQNRVQRISFAATAVVAITALAIPSVLGGASSRPLIQIGSSGQPNLAVGQGQNALGAESSARDAKMASSSMYLPYITYSYTDAGLGAEGTSGHIYQLVPKVTVGQLANALRSELGVSGSLNRGGNSDWEYFYFGDIDPYAANDEETQNLVWSKPVTVLSEYASMASFSFNDNSAQPTYRCPEVTYDSSGNAEASVDPCVPVPPANAIPLDVIAAKAKAIDFFKALGYEVGTRVKQTSADYLLLQVQQDEWNLNINGSLVVAGEVVNQTISLVWSVASGRLAYASGMPASAKDMGKYDVQSPAKTLERLGNYSWSGDFWADWNNFKWSTRMQNGVAYAVDDIAVGNKSSVSSGEVAVEPQPEPVTPEPMPSPTTVNIPVSKSELALLQVWDAEQRTWLVPGYLFYDDTGYVGNAFAVADGILKLPDYSQLPQPMTK